MAPLVLTVDQAFEEVVALVRETPKVETTSTDYKLQLYGLYKHVKSGPCSITTDPPSLLRVEAQAKYQAWLACRDMKREEAMQQYIGIVAAQDNLLGQTCRDIMQRCCSSINAIDEKQRGPTKSPESREGGIISEPNAQAATASIESLETPSFLSRILGIRPMIPRGQLDISYRDIAYAAFTCLRPSSMAVCRRHVEEITNQWNKITDRSIQVGLSVRSLLDLYLIAKQYPRGSQIIVTPPINVEGMMHVLAHHELEVVPIDIPESSSSEDNKTTARAFIGVDCPAIEKAVTPKTVAILIVHPFGMISTRDTEMRQIREIALKHKLDVLEDCAECFVGLGPECYVGSPHADITFFSFGLIKTATALGGGIAVLKDKTIQEKMNRLHFSLFEQQSTWEYLYKVLKSLMLRILGDLPLFYGMIAMICFRLGLDLDRIVASLVRSFPNNSRTPVDTFDVRIRQLRHRPCAALLAVLRRRLDQSRPILPSVSNRSNRCQKLTRILAEDIRDSSIVWATGVKTHWLFPVLHSRPDDICRILQTYGFDAARGTSQLYCVASPQQCPRSSQLMDKILYLPIASRDLSDSDIDRLARTLENACQDSNTSERGHLQSLSSCAIFGGRSVVRLPFFSVVVVLLLASTFSPAYNVVAPFVWLAIKLCLAFPISLLCIAHLLRWAIAGYYIGSSTGFAEFNGMLLDPALSGAEGDSPSDELNTGDFTAQTATTSGVVASLPVFDLPEKMQDAGRKVVLAGATGFIGSMFLRDILLNRKALSIEGVILICRKKRGMSPKDRVSNLLALPMFDFLSQREKNAVVHVVAGDVAQPNAGLSDNDITSIRNDAQITHVFNFAASVCFTQSLPDAATANISSALHLQSLTSTLSAKYACFVHLSTAFVHGGLSGSPSQPLPEELFPLGSYDPHDLYESMRGTEFYASKAMRDLRFPNSYAFSKCVCEHLLLQSTVDTVIVRPSIVGPAVRDPYEGWAGCKPSTLVAGACFNFTCPWTLWSFGCHKVPFIPVDVLSRFILAKSFLCALKKSLSDSEDSSLSEDDFEKVGRSSSESSYSFGKRSTKCDYVMMARDGSTIFTAAWDTASPANAFFTWQDYVVTTFQMGSILGHLSRPTVYVILLVATRLLPKAKITMEQFKRIYEILVQAPFMAFWRICTAFGLSLRWKLEKLEPLMDLPLLFFPFMNKPFHFRSELVAPSDFRAHRYVFSCVAAAHVFVNKSAESDLRAEEGKAPKSPNSSSNHLNVSRITVGGERHSAGASDAWWALNQPRGNYAVRFAAWIFVKILRASCREVTVDATSFASVVPRLRSMKNSKSIILVPTHRSFFDFILLSFVLFTLPELQIDMPFIAAAEEFQTVPFIGWMISWMQAFFVRRNGGQEDPTLADTVRSIEQRFEGSPPVFEIFIEGTRSRDRRFVKPRTGLLKCIQRNGGSYLIVPITINYDRIPEQEVLAAEAAGGVPQKMGLRGVLAWLQRVFAGKVSLGNIHVAASDPITVESSHMTVHGLVDEIQRRQQSHLYVSKYHMEAAAKLFQLDIPTLRGGFLSLGCKLWPGSYNESRFVELPTDESELWTIVLQAGPWLAPLVRSRRPEWSKWLGRVGEFEKDHQSLCPALSSVLEALLNRFDIANARVEKAIQQLKANGFLRPKVSHVLQTALQLGRDCPALLLRAAACMQIPNAADCSPVGEAKYSDSLIGCPLRSEEALGFWGFRDSGFVILMGTGVPYVTMKGGRYGLSGRRFNKLLPWIESEMKIRLNPLVNAFKCRNEVQRIVRSRLTAKDLELLKSTVHTVSIDTADRVRHGTGHSLEDVFRIRSGSDIRIPDVVVWPVSEQEVEGIIKVAKDQRWCLIPFGGGTNVSQATRCPPTQLEPRTIISVDMTMMNRILWVNEEDGLAHIEAGIMGRSLVEELRIRGYTIGHEPDSIEFSTLGGWIATKASGMKRSKYGNIEDIVKSVRVVSAGGILLHGTTDESAWGRESTGIDLSSLMLGSEGCLGIITSAVVRIWPLPATTAFDSVLLPDFDHGLQFVRDIARLGHSKPASCRLLDNDHFRLGQALRPESVSTMETFRRLIFEFLALLAGQWDPNLAVCVTLSYEGDREEVAEQKKAIARLVASHGGVRLGPRLGKAGYDLTFMIAYLRDFALTYYFLGESFETFAPWSKLSTIVRSTKECILREHTARLLPGAPFIGCRVTQLYHEGACLYFYMCINFEGVDNPMQIFTEIEHAAREEILSHGGSLSHHHGIGKARSSFLRSIDTSPFQDVKQSVKVGMDPDNIFAARNGAFGR